MQVCELMLSDEAAHIEFHSHRFAAWQWHWLPLARSLWAAQFQLFFLAAARTAWLDHRGALVAVGAIRREYAREARGECARFLNASNRPGLPGRLNSLQT